MSGVQSSLYNGLNLDWCSRRQNIGGDQVSPRHHKPVHTYPRVPYHDPESILAVSFSSLTSVMSVDCKPYFSLCAWLSQMILLIKLSFSSTSGQHVYIYIYSSILIYMWLVSNSSLQVTQCVELGLDTEDLVTSFLIS